MEATAFSSEALEAMRFNGLGFVNMRLRLMVQFLKTTPFQRYSGRRSSAYGLL
ncbi:MAG: hypothetical protein IPK21_17265 [Haliscomenobacter sp.]|nr:hypothetical protein [Haliscomenobacter sp.]